MKRKYILQHIAAFLLIFLVFAFIEGKINPFQWSIDDRAVLILCNLTVHWAVWFVRNTPY